MCVLCLPTLSPLTSAVVSFLCLFPFGGVSYNFICSPHLSLHDQQSSLYGEIEAWQYANCRERTRIYRFRMILIHKHTHGVKNKISWQFYSNLFSAECKNISAHMSLYTNVANMFHSIYFHELNSFSLFL